jgi:hypothetical protein
MCELCIVIYTSGQLSAPCPCCSGACAACLSTHIDMGSDMEKWLAFRAVPLLLRCLRCLLVNSHRYVFIWAISVGVLSFPPVRCCCVQCCLPRDRESGYQRLPLRVLSVLLLLLVWLLPCHLAPYTWILRNRVLMAPNAIVCASLAVSANRRTLYGHVPTWPPRRCYERPLTTTTTTTTW